jgi:hypothetical protein
MIATILIVVVFGIQSTAITSIEFADPAACDRAAAAIRDAVRSVTTVCAPKRY